VELNARAIVFVIAASAPLVAASLSTPEKKAVRREMIELDIAVRNMTSIIATGERKMLDDTLERLVTWQIKDHPEHGKVFREVLKKWESSGAIKFGHKVHTEANQLRGFVASHAKFGEAEWSRVQQSFQKILSACQGCHDMTYKKETP